VAVLALVALAGVLHLHVRKLLSLANRDALQSLWQVVAMNTAFLLMAQYNGSAIIPVDKVCKDYFSHLTPEKFVRKISLGEIMIPLVRMEHSQKCAKGIHLQDLADYLDQRRAAALKERDQLCY
jgi:hypothetical protein